MSGFQHQSWCTGGEHIGQACDHRTAINDGALGGGNGEPPTITALRSALTSWSDTVCWEPEGAMGHQVAYDVAEAAHAVLAEWDRGVAARHEHVKAALRDQVEANALVLPPRLAAMLKPTGDE